MSTDDTKYLATMGLSDFMPAFNATRGHALANNGEPPVSARCISDVKRFMTIAGQTTMGGNVAQTTLYIGLMCEELGEVLREVASGGVDSAGRTELTECADKLKALSLAMRNGIFMGNVQRADGTELLDGMLDTAWVALGAAISLSLDPTGAWREVLRANMDKFPGGVAQRDAGGKVVKPAGWCGPDLRQFL